MYGVTETGRQRATVVEDWIVNDMGFEQVNGVSHLFVKREKDVEISMILTKVNDDLLFSSEIPTVKDSSNNICNWFKERIFLDELIDFNRGRIEQNEKGNIWMCMNDYMQIIKTI